jgi:hypothetical protein
MADQYFFLLGLANSIASIIIFLIRKDHLELLESYGWIYLFLAIPAIYILFIVQRDQNALRYNIFLGIFLAFLALEGLLEFILKIPFRENWLYLIPYLFLYFAMNYGFIVMVWKKSAPKGILLLVLFVVQIISNMISH